MRILGIDSSLTATGLARIDIGGPGPDTGTPWTSEIATATVGAPKPSKDKSKQAMCRRVNTLLDLIEGAFDADIDAVGLEDLAYGAKGEGVWVLPWVFGRVIELTVKHGVPLFIVGTHQVKKFAVGKGSGPGTDKDHILAATIKLFPEADLASNNEADAIIVGAAVAQKLERPIVAMTQYRMDVVAALGS
jgi:Holliday junction resolvasome RuvABC endonuclease subunit